jgi:filamentous hemagglutinin family protein
MFSDFYITLLITQKSIFGLEYRICPKRFHHVFFRKENYMLRTFLGRKSALKKLTKISAACMSSFLISSTAFANPVLNGVIAGSAAVSQTGNTVTVNQSSEQAILEWKSFNINANEKTQFVQPDSSAVALNRIDPSQGASQIFGMLSSNGTIILVNGAGVHFGQGASVNVGSIIVSTSDISNANFLAGKYSFDQASTYGGTVVNEGKIVAANYGLVALLGNNVVNNGFIRAKMGNIVLATGDKFTFDFNGDQLINFTVDEAVTHGGYIKNTGALLADGGQILVSAQTAETVLDNVIDMQGVALANSVSQTGGEIVLQANNGTIGVSGKLIATGNSGQSGGNVKVLANNINITPGAVIDVSGSTGAGNITLAGDAAFDNAANIIIAPLSVLKASSYQTGGDGGSINIYANNLAVGGVLDVSSSGTNSFGGSVQLAANNVVVLPGSVINANGTEFAGQISIGANPYVNPTAAANSFIAIDAGSWLTANSSQTDSFGGLITIFAANTAVNGSVEASSTANGSFGGEINILGQNVQIGSFGKILANGNEDGGLINIGNNAAIVNGIAASEMVNVNIGSLVQAEAVGPNSVGGEINVEGNNATVSGIIDTSDALQTDGIGGEINITGQKINITPLALIDADGNTTGGQINVGNNPNLFDDVDVAQQINVDTGSLLTANAFGANATAGMITVAATNVNMGGVLSASANAAGGIGGTVDVSGQNITIASFATIFAEGAAMGGQINVGSNINSDDAAGSTNLVNIDAASLLEAGSTNKNSTGGAINIFANTDNVDGILDASGFISGSKGGAITILGQTVHVETFAAISAIGNAGGGTVSVGGSAHGTGPLFDATTTTVDAGSLINTSALLSGNGGNDVVWSNGTTTFNGIIISDGGLIGGSGGNVEVAGKKSLGFRGAVILLGGIFGKTGKLTLS